MENSRLLENVNAFMDFARDTKSDMTVAKAKLAEEIKSGERSDMTLSELDEAHTFAVDNYLQLVEARKSGDFKVVDELVEKW